MSVCLYVCMYVRDIEKHPLPEIGVLACDDKICSFFSVSMIFRVLNFFRVFGASLLWMMWELAGGGSVAVAVGVSDR